MCLSVEHNDVFGPTFDAVSLSSLIDGLYEQTIREPFPQLSNPTCHTMCDWVPTAYSSWASFRVRYIDVFPVQDAPLRIRIKKAKSEKTNRAISRCYPSRAVSRSSAVLYTGDAQHVKWTNEWAGQAETTHSLFCKDGQENMYIVILRII